MREPLWRSIGVGQLDHTCLLVRYGMLIGAVSFFVDQLSWKEDLNAHIKGDWGEARFVRHGYTRFQLSELTEDKNNYGPLPGVHVGLSFGDTKAAVAKVEDWASYAGVDCYVEDVPGGKYFVFLPDLFRVQFEFVPFPNSPTPIGT